MNNGSDKNNKSNKKKNGGSWGSQKPQAKVSAWGVLNTMTDLTGKVRSAPSAFGETQIVSSKGQIDYYDPAQERSKILHRILHLKKRGAFPFNRSRIMPTDHDINRRQQFLKDRNRPLHDYQIKGVRYLCSGSRRLLADGMGTGKAVDLGTLVPTPQGFRRAGDIQIGDELLGQNGLPCKVLGRYVWRDVDFYNVSFKDKSSVKTCGDHLWSVLHRSSWSKKDKVEISDYKTVSTKELFYSGVKEQHSSGPNYKYQIPLTEPVRYSEKKLPIDPYILGYYLGNGSSAGNGKDRLEFCVNENDLEVIAEITRYFKDSLNQYKPYSKRLGRHSKCYNLSIYGKRKGEFLDQLKELNLCGKICYSKFIPQIYKFGSVEQRLRLLQGILDSDGSLAKDKPSNDIRLSSSSYKLVHGVKEIVLSLGGLARIQRPISKAKESGEPGNPNWRLGVKFDNGIIPFTTSRQLSKYTCTKTEKSRGRKITDISYIGKRDGICFTVDEPNSLFLLQHYIVTHNTAQSLMALPANNVAGTIVICPSSVKPGWAKELAFWRPDLRLVVPPNKSRFKFPEVGEVVVVGWDSLPSIAPNFRNHVPFVLICDEAHFAKNEKTGRHKKVMYFVNLAEVTIGLTGTPLMNSVEDLWNVIQVSGMQRLPNEKLPLLGPRSRFSRTFFDWVKGDKRPVGCRPELVTILNSIYLRRTARDVCDEIPPITMVRLECEPNPKLAKQLDEILLRCGGEEGFRKKIEEAIEIHEKGGHVEDHLMRLRGIIDTAKLPVIQEFIESVEAAGDHIVVFSPFRNIITEHLGRRPGWGVLVGGMTTNQKGAVQNAFNDGRVRWLGITTAGATGVDLPGPDDRPCLQMVRTSLDWSPGVNAQVIKRIDRVAKKMANGGKGKNHPVHIYDFYLNHKIDHIVWSVIHKKRLILGALGLNDDVEKSANFDKDYYNRPEASFGQDSKFTTGGGFNGFKGGGGRRRGR